MARVLVAGGGGFVGSTLVRLLASRGHDVSTMTTGVPRTQSGVRAVRIGRWHPLNRSLYVGYKVMLAGLLMVSKGDRIAMHNSVETRYPFLDDDVISFCAKIAPEYKLNGLTEKWLLRQVAARALPKRIAKSWATRSPTSRMPRALRRRARPRSREAWIARIRLSADLSAKRSSAAIWSTVRW